MLCIVGDLSLIVVGYIVIIRDSCYRYLSMFTNR